ncbi:M50 family metallopeptidase [bacterium]|nr:M50 family metallopeptidase [bacterium]
MNVRWLLIAILLTIFLSFLPFAQIITYPFLIFSTFIHETSHALAAVLTGGGVESLIVRPNGSGVTYTRGGLRFVTSGAGYLGTTLFGALLLLLSLKETYVRPTLIACALLVLIVTAIFVGHTNNILVLAMIASISVLVGLSMRPGASEKSNKLHLMGVALGLLMLLAGYLILTRSLFSWSAGLLIAIALFGVVRLASLQFAHFFLTFLAVQCSLNALEAIKTVFFLSLGSTCGNDAATMASLTGIPAWIWAIFWAILSVVILAISTAFYARKSFRTSPVAI